MATKSGEREYTIDYRDERRSDAVDILTSSQFGSSSAAQPEPESRDRDEDRRLADIVCKQCTIELKYSNVEKKRKIYVEYINYGKHVRSDFNSMSSKLYINHN